MMAPQSEMEAAPTFQEAEPVGAGQEAEMSLEKMRARIGERNTRKNDSHKGHSTAQDSHSDNESIDDNDLFDELERELEDDGRPGVMGRLREQRMTELQQQIRQEQAAKNAPRGMGKLTEPASEKELIQILGDRGGELSGLQGASLGANGMPVIVHFYHKEFRRCDIMDKHLELLAAQHPESLFVKISVLSSPFLVEKLAVKVLPCLVVFGHRAQVKDRIVGFEDLGNSDGFTTQTLEWRLAQGGALYSKAASGALPRPILGFSAGNAPRDEADDYDLDWD